MTSSFGRVVEFIAGTRKFSSDDFYITFNIPFDDKKEPTVAEVKIYNLTDKSINEIKKDSPVILNAGYRGDVGSALLGYVQKVFTEWQGVDKVTTIQCVDGASSWLKVNVQKTYKAGTTAKQILADLAGMTGMQLGVLDLETDRVYKSGKTINSALGNAISNIAAECGSKAYSTRGKIMIRPDGAGDVTGVVIDKEHGLIASPTMIEKETGRGKKKKTVTGWKVVLLLDHRITTDSYIEIKSKTANGVFRVGSGVHNGDTFNTELEVYSV